MGVLESACNEAVKRTKNNRIGVIGTAGTIKSGKYEEIIKTISPDMQVFSTPCPMFVPLVENGYADSEAARLIAKDYLTSLKSEKVDTLILGCTHYPLLKGVISDIMGEETVLLSPGELTALAAREYLIENGLLSERQSGGKNEFYVSDSVENFAQLGSTFLGSDIGAEVHKTEAFAE
jgi:glutamate racemase